MRNTWLLRILVGAVVVLLIGWIVHKTSWVEVEEPDAVRGAAATDPNYSLRAIVAAGGSTLETRSSLEPLPPTTATLVLESSFWNIFPERDAQLKDWVVRGGHLVVFGARMQDPNRQELRWIPLAFKRPPARHAPGAAASDAANARQADDDGDDDEKPASAPQVRSPLFGKRTDMKRHCLAFDETEQTTAPAYEPGRVYSSCVGAGYIRAVRVAPTWQLTGLAGTLAMRVPVGRGSVTGLSLDIETGNQEILKADHALIADAVLDTHPGRAVWLIEDEAREPLMIWLWQQTRTPLLLGAAAVALALWRLMVRFGPRVAPPARARRSMGEQVRGTGQFIATLDPEALHGATRKAFDDVARTRIEHYAELNDNDRVVAVVALLAASTAFDAAALLSALHPGPRSTPHQWLAAIDLVEQARRALLRATATPHS